MTVNLIKCLTQIATYLKVNPGKITLDLHSTPIRSFNNLTTTGFASIIFRYLEESGCDITDSEASKILQWLEYCIVYVANANNAHNIEQIMKELDELLSTKTYLVSCRVSIADVSLFYLLHDIMVNLSYLDKEKYLNVSRWFDNIQQDDLIRQKRKMIDFTTNYLSCNAPARH